MTITPSARGAFVALTILASGCAPHVPPGPSTAARAAAPSAVVMLDDPEAPLLVEVRVAAGAAYDPIGREGLAASVATTLAAQAPGLEASIGRDWVSFHRRCAPDRAASCLASLISALTTPPPGVAVASSDETARDPAEALLEMALYEGHPYGHPLTGRESTRATLEPRDARGFHHDRYVREALTVGLTGPWTAAQRAALAEQLEAVPARPAAPLVLPRPPRAPPVTLVLESPGPSTGVYMGHAVTLERGGDEEAALHLLAHTLSRRPWPVALSARVAGAGPARDGSPRTQLHLVLGIAGDSPDAVLATATAVRTALATLRDEGLEDDELTASRATLTAELRHLTGHPRVRLAHALDAASPPGLDLLSWLPEAVDRVDRSIVDAAIRDHLRPDDLVVVARSDDGAALLASWPSGASPTAPRAIDGSELLR